MNVCGHVCKYCDNGLNRTHVARLAIVFAEPVDVAVSSPLPWRKCACLRNGITYAIWLMLMLDERWQLLTLQLPQTAENTSSNTPWLPTCPISKFLHSSMQQSQVTAVNHLCITSNHNSHEWTPAATDQAHWPERTTHHDQSAKKFMILWWLTMLCCHWWFWNKCWLALVED